jgi:MFS family permease
LLHRLWSSLARAASALPIARPGLSAPGAAGPLRGAPDDGARPAATVERRALRRSLRASVAEGAVAEVFTACATGAVVTGWALHLGADPVLVGTLSAMPLAAQVVHLPAAWVTARTSRRRLAILAVSGSRLAWAPMALLAWWALPREAALAWLVAIVALSSVLSVIGNNAWTAWMGDLVPSRLRGRFFGRRTMWVTVAGGASWLVTGLVLDGLGPERQRTVLAALSLVAALSGVATALLMRLQVDPVRSPPAPVGFGAFALVLRDARARSFLLYQLAWGAAVAPAATYWSLHVLGNLGLGFLFIAGHGLLAALVRIVTVAAWGRAVDRYGARPVLAACSMGIGVMPLLWITASPTFFWPLVLDAVIAGCMWGGHGVAALDLPLAVAPRRERPFYLAAFATAAGVGFAASSLLSSSFVALAPRLVPSAVTPFEVLFLVSGLGRFSCGVLALRLADAKDRSLRELLRAVAPAALALVRRR